MMRRSEARLDLGCSAVEQEYSSERDVEGQLSEG
jgi:hypothetical protein